VNRFIDVEKCRALVPYSKAEYFFRVLWGFVSIVYRFTPRTCHFIRVALLRGFGAKIGCGVQISPKTEVALPWMLEIGDFCAIGDSVTLYSLGKIRIGNYVTISQFSHVCAGTHDYSRISFDLLRRSITIEDGVWICANVFIGPGVSIAEGCVVGAGTVVTETLVEKGGVYRGNPALLIKSRLIKPE